MDDDFFNDPHKEEEDFQGYAEVGEEQHSHLPQSQDVTSAALGSSAINNTAVNYGEEFEMAHEPSQEVDETLLRFRQEEELLLQKLRLKAVILCLPPGGRGQPQEEEEGEGRQGTRRLPGRKGEAGRGQPGRIPIKRERTQEPELCTVVLRLRETRGTKSQTISP